MIEAKNKSKAQPENGKVLEEMIATYICMCVDILSACITVSMCVSFIPAVGKVIFINVLGDSFN